MLDYGTRGYQGLSYSRLCTLHSCPRKFQIENAFGFREHIDTVTFSFGHAVGAGIQEYITTKSIRAAVIACAKHYTIDWTVTGTITEAKNKKNVWYAIHATKLFCDKLESKLPDPAFDSLREYKVATITNQAGVTKPAVELQFRIQLDNGYVYEGHIDLILQHVTTGEYCILELKTTSFNQPNRASYGKSGQALGYTIVLDHMLKHAATSYKVSYFIWSSSSQQFTAFEYNKTAKQRLNWINDLIRDTELIDYYESCATTGIPYPINGASCYSFFHECEYYTTCEMEDSSLKLIYSTRADQAASFNYEDNTDFVIPIAEILATQLIRVQDQAGTEISIIDNIGTTNGQTINI